MTRLLLRPVTSTLAVPSSSSLPARFHTCALLDTGAVRCWGYGDDGKLGYGNTSDIGDDEVPALAGNVPVLDSILRRAAGVEHNCGLLDISDARFRGVPERPHLSAA
jgi:hypothetical protein